MHLDLSYPVEGVLFLEMFRNEVDSDDGLHDGRWQTTRPVETSFRCRFGRRIRWRRLHATQRVGLLLLVLRPLHEQQPGQDYQEESLDAGHHHVGRRRPEVNIQNENRHNYGTRDQNHRKQEILSDQGRGQGSGRVDFRDQQQEDVERIKDGNGHGDLLSRIGWNEEDEESDSADGDTW